MIGRLLIPEVHGMILLVLILSEMRTPLDWSQGICFG
jgi:hypothetical protein